METVNTTTDQFVAQVGNISIIARKSEARETNIESRHQPLSYEIAKKAGLGLRGSNGNIHVLLYVNKAGGYSASVKLVSTKDGAELGSLWLSKGLVKALIAKHQDEVGQWQDVVKLHDSGNATVTIPSASIRFYGLRKTDTGEEWTVIGTVATGGASVA